MRPWVSCPLFDGNSASTKNVDCNQGLHLTVRVFKPKFDGLDEALMRLRARELADKCWPLWHPDNICSPSDRHTADTSSVVRYIGLSQTPLSTVPLVISLCQKCSPLSATDCSDGWQWSNSVYSSIKEWTRSGDSRDTDGAACKTGVRAKSSLGVI